MYYNYLKIQFILAEEDIKKPYDWTCKNGFKIKHIASCLRFDAIHPPYWGYNIRNNKIPDYFILSAWDNRDSLMPEHIWMIQRDTILKSQRYQPIPIPFWGAVQGCCHLFFLRNCCLGKET